MTVEEIRRRGRASRHYYWRCWALRQGATDSEALHVAEALERQLQTGRAPGMADQVRVSGAVAGDKRQDAGRTMGRESDGLGADV